MEKHELAHEDYKSGMKYKDIAKKHGVSLSTVKSWKTRYKWQKGMGAKKEKICVQNEKSTHAKSASVEAEKQHSEVKNEIVTYTGLTDRQRIFCDCWLKNKNATIAAINAGYAPRSAHVEGNRLLKNAKVREYIQMFISEVKNNIMLDVSEIVERYMKIAFSDITDFVDFFIEEVPVIINGKIVTTKDAVTGNPIPVTKTVNVMRLKDSTIVDGGLISEISIGKDGAKIKLQDQQKALDFLSKYFMMNPMDSHKVEYDNAIRTLKDKNMDKSHTINEKRIELEERKYRLMKQKIMGEFEYNPETGEINDNESYEDNKG